jgi:hypothetical protein
MMRSARTETLPPAPWVPSADSAADCKVAFCLNRNRSACCAVRPHVAGLNDDRRLDHDFATLCATGRGEAAGFKGYILRGLEDDPAVFGHDCAVGADRARLIDESRVDADTPGFRDDGPEVDRLVVRSGDFDPQVGRSGIDKLNPVTCRQDDLTFGRSDDPGW